MLAANYIDVEQQSPEWLEMRKGMVTGSMVRHAVSKMKTQPKNGPTAYMQFREDYLEDIVTTRLTGDMPDRYVSKAMKEGVELESSAIAEYEMRQGVMVESIGFVFHPTIQWYGSSPDGLLGSDIVIEAKCPTQATHLRYLREYVDAKEKGLEYIPDEYKAQVKAHLSCTERPMCHFISFHPRFPKHLRLLVSPYRRDKGAIAEQDAEVQKFLDEAASLERFMGQLEL